MYYVETPEGVILNVKAQPRSSRAGIDGLIGDAVKVRIKCAPVDGKANKELVETLADAFGLAKSAVTFKSGETSKTKRILLRGITAQEVETLVLRGTEKVFRRSAAASEGGVNNYGKERQFDLDRMGLRGVRGLGGCRLAGA